MNQPILALAASPLAAGPLADPAGSHQFYTYLAYLVISIGLTVWVARTLNKGGRVFLVDVFDANEELADSVNRLLVVGFYLLNLGFVSLFMKQREVVQNAVGGIEALSSKIGAVLLVLGAVHFLNLYVFSRIRRRASLRHAPPPVPPTSMLPERDPSGPGSASGSGGFGAAFDGGLGSKAKPSQA
tara:strand:- start:1365 stop:1919 length:555 start_codon:yes stop_codon:yes gene_type:complete